MQYIKVKKIFSKLSQASKNLHTIYISGSIGMGKTAAVEYYFRRKPAVFISGATGTLDSMPKPKELSGKAVVVDHVSLITDEKSKAYVKGLLNEDSFQTVLIGRSEVPPWLASEAISHEFSFANNKDLALTAEDIIQLFSPHLEFFQEGNEDYKMITEGCYNNTQMYMHLKSLLEEGNTLNDNLITINKINFFRHMDVKLYDLMTEESRSIMLKLCLFKNFPIELAADITGDAMIGAKLEQMSLSGDYLRIFEDGYRIRRLYRDYFIWKRSTVLNEDDSITYSKAAEWYEAHNDYKSTLEYYKLAGDTEKIRQTLAGLVIRYPGMENFREVYPYFGLLSEEQIESTPELMAGLSLIYSIMLRPDDSDYWYGKLKEFVESRKKNDACRMGALGRILLLDLTLPHREKNTEDTLMAIQEMGEDFSLSDYEHMSVIDNVPSILNASTDICELCLYLDGGTGIGDEEIELKQAQMDVLLGKRGKGYAQLARLEWQYERMEIDSHDLVIALNNVYVEACSAGAYEIAFVATAILSRNYLSDGKFPVAKKLINDFKNTFKKADVSYLDKGVDGFEMDLNMYGGENQQALKWLTDHTEDLEILSYVDRQLHIYQVMVLITLGRYDEATLLVGKLKVISKMYPRPYFDIQLTMLEAIILFRIGKKEYNGVLESALIKSSRYGFIRCVAELGAALELPLSNLKTKQVDPEYLFRVREETSQMALAYPNYMQKIETVKEQLTAMEAKVVRLMCSELSTNEICERLHISYSGLKFHNKNIYRKLNVNNRVDAQRVAKSFGLNVS